MGKTSALASPGAKALTILVGVLLLAGCSSSTSGGDAAPSENSDEVASEVDTVKIGIIPVAEFASVYIAQDEGYFAEEGLEVETQVIQNAASIAPSVLNGQLQFGTAAVSPFVAAAGTGIPLVAVANGSSVSPDPDADPSAILVMPDSGIKSPAELVGKTVAVNALGSVSHVTAAANIDQDGGDFTQTTFVAMPFPDMIAALERGTIDAATVVEPFQVQGTKNGAEVLSHPNSETLESGTFTLFFTSKEFAEKNPDTVERFQRAVNKASLAAAADPALAARVLESNLSLDPALLEEMRMPLYSDDLNTASLQNMADLMLELGLMENEFDVSGSVWSSGK